MAYMIGYVICAAICMLYLMIFAEDAVKKRHSEWTWNYEGIIVCSVIWPVTLAFAVGGIMDGLMKRALVINYRYRKHVRQQVVDDEKSEHKSGGVRIEE